jgi:hypothetical protein
MPAAQGPPTLQVGGRGRKAQVAFLRLLKAHGWRTSLQAESSGACVRRKRRNRANQSLLPRKSPRKQNHRPVKPGETSGLPRQHGILLTPRNGNENLSTINGQATPKDLGAVGGLPGGLVESTASTLKSNPEGQRQTSDQAKGATLGQSISRVLNGPGPPSRPVAGFQPPVAASGPRRSARIAKLQQRKGASERESQANMAPKRKHSAAAPHEANETSRPKQCKPAQETRKEPFGTNTRKRAGRRLRSEFELVILFIMHEAPSGFSS